MLVRSMCLVSLVLFLTMGVWSVDFLLSGYATWLHLFCFGMACIASAVFAFGIITYEEGVGDD